jgi:hypothetical protein
MLGWLRRPTYDLLIEPERITLAKGKVRAQVEPRITLGDRGRIVSVGAQTPGHGGRVVELLGPVSQTERPRFEERFNCFQATFRHLMRVAQKGSILALRPDVRVHGAAVLGRLLDVDVQAFLRDALVGAGAVKVEFAG